MKNNLSSVVGLLTVMILKRVCVREYFFFQSKKFKTCEVKDRNRGAKIFDNVQSMEDYPSILR